MRNVAAAAIETCCQLVDEALPPGTEFLFVVWADGVGVCGENVNDIPDPVRRRELADHLQMLADRLERGTTNNEAQGVKDAARS